MSMVILGVVGYAVSGREVPVEAVTRLREVVPEDLAPTGRNLALAFIVGMFVAGTPLHTFLRYLSTVVHELGHAFTAGLLGGRPKNIAIAMNAGGLAVYSPPLTWGRFRATIVSLAGYPAPAVASVAAVRASQSGHPKAWFFFAAGTLALGIVFLIRNFWGFLWTAVVVAGSYYGARELTVEFIGMIVGGVAGYLAVEGCRNAWEQLSIIRVATGSGCDAERVANWWRIGPRFVGFLHLVAVVSTSSWATHLAVQPYWGEITAWMSQVTRT